METNVITQIIDAFTRPNEQLIIIDEAFNENLLNIFAYGSHNGGYVDTGTVKINNYMRYNETSSIGPVTIYNVMHL